MAEAAAARKVGDIVVPEAVYQQNVAKRTQAQRQQETATVATPTDNAIYKIVFGEGSPEQKRAALKAYLTFPGTKAESRARADAYRAFEEWLQSERKRMAREIIRLTDTEAFAELQKTYQAMNGDLVEFDEKLKPLLEILQAVYDLRGAGKTLDAFIEIQQDKAHEAERKAQQEADEARFTDLRARIDSLRKENAQLGEQKALFGYGGIKASARTQMAVNQVDLDKTVSELDAFTAEVGQRDDAKHISALGDMSKQKEKLRELLDLNADTHTENQKALLEATRNFCDHAEERAGAVRQHFEGMAKQIEALSDTNSQMLGVYAVMADGLHDAVEANTEMRTDLTAAPADESTFARLDREDRLNALEDHVAAMDKATGSTIETIGDLTKQAVNVRTMRSSNQDSIEQARRMQAQGVAGVADQLSVVVNAISSAAIGESAELLRGNLTKMVERTGVIAQQEVIKQSMNIQQFDQDITHAIDNLQKIGDVLQTGNTVYREGLESLHGNLDRMRGLADATRGTLREAAGITSEVVAGHEREETSAPPKADTNSPFTLGGR